MNRIFLTGAAVSFLFFCGGPAADVAAQDKPAAGEELFKTHCQVCHPDGGNIINKEKPLTRKALSASGIKTPRDIVKQMRNPGTGMTTFGEKEVPDRDAEAIAKYILKTFK